MNFDKSFPLIMIYHLHTETPNTASSSYQATRKIQLAEFAMCKRYETLGYVLTAQSWHKTTSISSAACNKNIISKADPLQLLIKETHVVSL